MRTTLPEGFYMRTDTVQIARELIGKTLVTIFDGKLTSGRIVETEAYNGLTDRASHAYNGRRTRRTEVMYRRGGIAYVYLCYGMHHLFNVVTDGIDIPHAVLIRAIEPLEGISVMQERVGGKGMDGRPGRGPGKLSRALGITVRHTGQPLQGSIRICEEGYEPFAIDVSRRIGVDYAGEDAALPYRFYVPGNPFVSRHPGS